MSTFDKIQRAGNCIASHTVETIFSTLDSLDQILLRDQQKSLRCALKILLQWTTICVVASLPFSCIVLIAVLHSMLDMFSNPIMVGQGWEEAISTGLNIGLALRVVRLVARNFFCFSCQETVVALFLAGFLFFHNDFDQLELPLCFARFPL